MTGRLGDRVMVIAANTFLEAVRQKFVSVLVILAGALVLSSSFFQRFNFGSSELKFIADFGWGAILLFGTILAIVATAQLFFSEIENRTALTILAKPVYRAEFLLGKYLGVLGLLVVFTGLMSLLLGLLLWWRESALVEAYPDAFAEGGMVSYSGLAMASALELVRFGVVIGFTLLVASFSNTNLYTVVIAFFLFVICQLQYVARDGWAEVGHPLIGYLVWTFSLLLPNFQVFNVTEALTFGGAEAPGALVILGVAGYGLIYLAVFFFLAFLAFRKREI